MRIKSLLTVALLIASGCLAKEGKMPATAKSMDDILKPGTSVEKVAGDFMFTEGPVWVLEGGYLLFSDIPANSIYRWSPPSTEAEVWRTPSGNSNGLTLDAEGRLVACEHGNRRVSRTEADGTVTTLVDRYEGKRLNSPNDVVVRSDGSIYFTDPPYGLPKQEEGRELPFNGVYRISPDGTLTLLDDTFVRPNGLAFSPDEGILYVDDTSEMHIRAFDVEPDGTLSNGRVFADLRKPGLQGAPDGMKVDVQGNVYCTGPGGIWVHTPEGAHLGVIETPEVPANLAWGDEDMKALYVTARTGLYRVRTQIGGTPAGKDDGAG
jgi:sugar lactone lactonase YvrE